MAERGYLLNEQDVATLQQVTQKVLRAQAEGRANYHREELRGRAGGSLKFYVVVATPNGGAGTGTVAAIALDADGTWTATAETATKVFPELG